jgi:hypothetical protein
MSDPNTGAYVVGGLILLIVLCACFCRRGRRGGKGGCGFDGDGSYRRLKRQVKKLTKKIECCQADLCKPKKPCCPVVPAPTTTLVAPFSVEHTVFVDGLFGNNATALVQRPDRPFATIQAAVNAAGARATTTQQWQVQIRPDTYTETVTMLSHVDLLGVAPNTSLQTSLGAAVQVPEVTIVGRLVVPVTIVGPMSFQGIAVQSTAQSALLVAGGTGTSPGARALTFTQCLFHANYPTATPTNFLGVELNETSLLNTSVVFDDCSILHTHIPTAVTGIVAINIYTEVSNLRILRSRMVTLATLFGTTSAHSTIQVYIADDATNDTDLVVESLDNQYVTIINNLANQASSTLVALFQLDSGSGNPNTYTVTSLADSWNIGGAGQDDVIPASVAIVSQGAIVVSSVQVQSISVRSDLDVTGAFQTLHLTAAPSATSAIYFRGLIGTGIGTYPDGITPPGTNFAGGIKLIQTDMMLDNTQSGQFFPGTVTRYTTAAYTVDILDAIVQYDGALASTVFLPAATEYPGRMLIFNNLATAAVTVTVTGFPAFAVGLSLMLYSDGSAWQRVVPV